MSTKNYAVGEVNLENIRNRNELRIIERMPLILTEYPDYMPESLDIQDIYALALNTLPPRYIQQGSIVLGEPVRLDMVDDALRDAIETVRARPKYS